MGLDIRELALDTLSISRENVRKDPGDLTELIASITAVGVLEPILVRPMGEGYEVIAGYRRTEAARRAGLTTIPASVLELTDVQAILTSLIENIQRKDLSLEERVVTYQQLQALEPEYRSQRALAKHIGRSHRNIGEDFQKYEIAMRLQPHGIRVESDFPRTSPERQRGEVIPQYHAVLVHQAISSLVATGALSDAESDEKLYALVKRVAPLSQAAAKAYIERVKGTWSQGSDPDNQAGTGEPASTWQFQPVAASQGENGGLVTCACCKQALTLVHYGDGTHAVTPQPGQLADQQEMPGLIS